MINKEKVIAIVPAREGSKRIPNKNIRHLNDKPLITYSIEAGLNSSYIDKLIVSTDSKRIAEISQACRAEVPFLRPSELASDTAGSFEVVQHALLYMLNEENAEFDYLLLLQPTSPLRTSKDIDSALELLIEKSADAIVSVCETDHSPIWTNTIPDNLSMDNFVPKKHANIRSQDLPTYYRLNGAIYITRISQLLKERQFILSKNTFAHIMPQNRSIDIDNEIDFQLAEILLSNV